MRKLFYTLLACICCVAICSCSTDGEFFTIDTPADKPVNGTTSARDSLPALHVVFNEDGYPVPEDWKGLTEEEQRILQKEVVGYGWKWLHTEEIDKRGIPMETGFYDEMIGMSPHQYYFSAENELTQYFFSDALPGLCFSTSDILLDYNTGIVCYPNKHHVMTIWAIRFGQDGAWHLHVIEYMGLRACPPDGQLRPIYASSEYMRMTDKELEAYKETYTTRY